ncbi:MAG: hypothetical protein ACLR23_03300 [Clostridia bacterium]
MDWIAEYLPKLVYWAITGALAVVCGTLWKRVQKTHAQEAVERNAIREGVIAMLHIYAISNPPHLYGSRVLYTGR